MTILTKAFWVDAAERAVSTAAQAALAVIGVDQVSALDLNYEQIGGVALGGALLSLLKAFALSDRHSPEPGRSAWGPYGDAPGKRPWDADGSGPE